MRILLLLAWLTLPVLGIAYHYGPGQEQLTTDRAASAAAAAQALAARESWAEAELQFDEALSLLPAERSGERQRLRLERAKVQMQNKKLPEAHDELQALVDELAGDPKTDPKLLADARSASAGSQYYMTWLLRLEGQPRERWEPEIDAARQTYRLLAEEAQASGDDASVRRNKEDLESAIRLARMDLSDLQGLPLPSQ